MKVRLALLWHMHQPMYVDPATGTAILPWVRLHATHAYYDMGRILERHPGVRATVNFVPCLLEQLESAAAGVRRERYLDLSRAAVETLSREDRAFVIRQFFMVDRERGIRPYPRYWQLLEKRGEDPERIDPARFSDDDVRDIQVLFNLTWMGYAARHDEPDVARLVVKGHHFSEEDKAALLAAQQRIVQRVVPLWRGLAERGQVELSSTPYFHPILPLVCDTDAARRAMPDARLPPRFSRPDDAREQVRLALELHARLFGAPPAGMWPAEGALSPEALEVLARAGVKWVATDEANLFRSTPAPTKHGELYQPWQVSTPAGPVAVAFRDRAISDRIGFTYAREKAMDAVIDLLAHVRRAGAQAAQAGIAQPLVAIVLDGENAWERYVDHGEPFLDALYTALEGDSRIQTLTMSEALARPMARLERIHSGSWIDSNYRIWIGHEEDNLGWELLGQVRALVQAHEERGDVAADKLAQARRHLLAAEGSDWFWWYGDDFSTENASEFDALFRDRLVRAAALVGESAPARLSEPLSKQARRQSTRQGPQALAGIVAPRGLLSPTIDGRTGCYSDWLGAGVVRPARLGSMHRSETVLSALHFGCDDQHLYLRLDPAARLDGARLQVSIANERGGFSTVEVPVPGTGPLTADVGEGAGMYADVVELKLPLGALGLAARQRAELTVTLRRDGLEVDRLPSAGTAMFEVPDADFERRHWIV